MNKVNSRSFKDQRFRPKVPRVLPYRDAILLVVHYPTTFLTTDKQ